MSEITREAIVTAAVAAAGPMNSHLDENGNPDLGIWRAAVEAAVGPVYALLDEKSSIMRTVDSIAGAKKFVSVITKVEKHEASTRGVIHLAPKENGDEERPVRTPITKDNDAARMLAKRCQSLVGHRVVLFVALEQFGSEGHSMRVLRHVEDLGVDGADD